MSVARSSFNRSASSAARTRSQCGPSEVLVTGRGRFLDAIMLLVRACFSLTGWDNDVRYRGHDTVSWNAPSVLSIPLERVTRLSPIQP